MPSLNMKNNQSASCLRESTKLHVCQKSNVISKKSCSPVKNFLQTTDFGPCIHEFQSEDVLSVTKVSNHATAADAAIVDNNFMSEENFQSQKMESKDTCSQSSEMIVSQVLDQPEVLNEPRIENRADSNNNLDVARPRADDNDNRSSWNYQTSNISDFSPANMIIASVPVEEDNSWMYYILNDNCTESNMLFDVDGQFMFLPQLEDFAENNSSINPVLYQETLAHPNNEDLFAILDEMRSINRRILLSDSGQENMDPYSVGNVPELSDVVSDLEPAGSPKETQAKKSVTLVLDLDETLVHSTSHHCDDADFSFTVLLDTKEQTVFVKKRPHLQTFLERVAEMFEVVVFTASLSVYAEQLLDILDPGRKLISQRAYRESCIFTDGIYTKDLTILGVDLAKIAIIDNSPQVFRLQVNNGIPIKSWFDDPTDSALISLLPFLETLANAEDVRPLIAEKFNNKE